MENTQTTVELTSEELKHIFGGIQTDKNPGELIETKNIYITNPERPHRPTDQKFLNV